MQNAHQVYKDLITSSSCLSLLSLLALDEDTGSWPLGQCFIRRNILFNQPHN